jgi:Transcription factor TFIIH complex subunit Tfb5
MPKAIKGVLVKVDVATKIYLMKLNEYEKFKIMDIDDRYLFIKDSELEFVQSEVKKYKEKSRLLADEKGVITDLID